MLKTNLRIETDFGFLRETEEDAIKAGIDKETGIKRTGMDTYLKVIFPEVTDWIHDKTFPKEIREVYELGLRRPDYRSEQLKMIIEFDGIQHFQKPDIILRDEESYKIYEECGYKLFRIPYFIQLTNDVVKQLFHRDVNIPLFPRNVPSLGLGRFPANLCPLGITRMAREYLSFPNQYELEKLNMIKVIESGVNSNLIGLGYLTEEYRRMQSFL